MPWDLVYLGITRRTLPHTTATHTYCRAVCAQVLPPLTPAYLHPTPPTTGPTHYSLLQVHPGPTGLPPHTCHATHLPPAPLPHWAMAGWQHYYPDTSLAPWDAGLQHGPRTPHEPRAGRTHPPRTPCRLHTHSYCMASPTPCCDYIHTRTVAPAGTLLTHHTHTLHTPPACLPSPPHHPLHAYHYHTVPARAVSALPAWAFKPLPLARCHRSDTATTRALPRLPTMALPVCHLKHGLQAATVPATRIPLPCPTHAFGENHPFLPRFCRFPHRLLPYPACPYRDTPSLGFAPSFSPTAPTPAYPRLAPPHPTVAPHTTFPSARTFIHTTSQQFMPVGGVYPHHPSCPGPGSALYTCPTRLRLLPFLTHTYRYPFRRFCHVPCVANSHACHCHSGRTPSLQFWITAVPARVANPDRDRAPCLVLRRLRAARLRTRWTVPSARYHAARLPTQRRGRLQCLLPTPGQLPAACLPGDSYAALPHPTATRLEYTALPTPHPTCLPALPHLPTPSPCRPCGSYPGSQFYRLPYRYVHGYPSPSLPLPWVLPHYLSLCICRSPHTRWHTPHHTPAFIPTLHLPATLPLHGLLQQFTHPHHPYTHTLPSALVAPTLPSGLPTHHLATFSYFPTHMVLPPFTHTATYTPAIHAPTSPHLQAHYCPCISAYLPRGRTHCHTTPSTPIPAGTSLTVGSELQATLYKHRFTRTRNSYRVPLPHSYCLPEAWRGTAFTTLHTPPSARTLGLPLPD